MQNFLHSPSKKILLVVAAFALFIGITFFFTKDSQKPIREESAVTESSAPSTQATVCSGEATPEQTEGPYYTANTPQRNNIAEDVEGEKLVVTGYVYDTDCKPLANAWVDFWQADSQGNYDNEGYNLRGHQYTDENGAYRLETIVPAEYPGRPPHIHVKVQPENGSLLTSQIYFPGETRNATDSIFDQRLVMKVSDGENGKLGEFNFILNQ